MSGKYVKQKARKKKSIVPVLLIAVIVLLLAVAAFFLTRKDEAVEEIQQTQDTAAATETQQTEGATEPGISLRNDLEVLDIGPYTGIYMEDGTDEIVSGVLMMKLLNNGEDTVQYARITMEVNGEIAEFTCSTLKPGDSIVLLEQNRMEYDSAADYAAEKIACENLALFQEPLSLQEDKISVQILNGAINVTNVSGQDISGRISIYYKNKAAGVYYGGITYRITIEGGLKAGEIRQMMASHFAETGSEIMFVTIA